MEVAVCGEIQEAIITLMDAHSLVMLYSFTLMKLEWRKLVFLRGCDFAPAGAPLCADKLPIRQARVKDIVMPSDFTDNNQ